MHHKRELLIFFLNMLLLITLFLISLNWIILEIKRSRKWGVKFVSFTAHILLHIVVILEYSKIELGSFRLCVALEVRHYIVPKIRHSRSSNYYWTARNLTTLVYLFVLIYILKHLQQTCTKVRLIELSVLASMLLIILILLLKIFYIIVQYLK